MTIVKSLILASLCVALAACGGGGGGDSAPGVEPGPAPAGGNTPPPDPVQPAEPAGLQVGDIGATDTVTTAMTGVSFNSPLTITFSLLVNGDQPVMGLSSGQARFTLSRLMPSDNGEHENWMSYITSSEDPVCRDQGDVDDSNNDCTTFTAETDPAAIPDSALAAQDPVATGKVVTTQATYERSGTFTDNGDGSWSYTYSADPGDPALLSEVHRACIQFSLNAPAVNPCIDFVPSDLVNPAVGDMATSLHSNFYDSYQTRKIVNEATCNTCHAKLAIHGGGRTATDYCVTCHNPGSTDGNSGNSVDLKVMVHRIHNARDLASVQEGTPYKIWGFRNGEHDYSHVSYPPGDLLGCTRCHAGQEDVEWRALQGLPAPVAMLTPDGHNWANKPNPEACLSCHEGATEHAQDHAAEGCAACHGDNQFASVQEKHRNQVEETASLFSPSILEVNNTAPGEFPEIRFRIDNPVTGEPYDVLADPAWTQGGGASRLALDLAWSSSDYSNTGNGSEMASAVSINGLGATPVGDGSFTVTSPVAIPDGSGAPGFTATGSGAIGIEGHPAVDLGEDGEVAIARIPMDNEVAFFSIDDGSPVARRDIIDVEKCQNCHRNLSLHGSNRNNNEQVCALCHNPRNTDREVRGIAFNPPTDGKVEESLDFKQMIHAIHASGMRENPIQIVGFRGFNTHVYDEEHLQYPGDLSNCNACHVGNSYDLPLASSVLPTTVSTGADHEDPADDLVTTPSAMVCSSCHDKATAQSHMKTNGALFAAPMGEAELAVESCDVCHSNNSSAGLNLVHPGLR